MVKRNGVALSAAALAAVLFAAYEWHLSGKAPVGLAAAPVKAKSDKDAMPWTNIDRLKLGRPVLPLGRRNIFEWLPRPVEITPPPPPTVPPDMTDAPPQTPTPTAPPEPLRLKFIGLLEQQGKRKIAVLMSEQKEIMPGREGDLLAGRYRIVKIGLESVDVEDVTTGQTQKIALRGN